MYSSKPNQSSLVLFNVTSQPSYLHTITKKFLFELGNIPAKNFTHNSATQFFLSHIASLLALINNTLAMQVMFTCAAQLPKFAEKEAKQLIPCMA